MVNLCKKDPFKIAFTGTINIKKENIDIFVEALSLLKDENNFIFHLYGFMDKENELQLNKIINSFELGNYVEYKGVVESKVVSQKLKEYNLLVLPRGRTLQNHYGFSTKLSEYLISGIPTLVTDVSDNKLYIKDNYNGFIIEPDSLSAFVKKMKFIITNYTEYADKVAIEAYNTSKNNFDYKLYSQKLTNFLFEKKNK